MDIGKLKQSIYFFYSAGRLRQIIGVALLLCTALAANASEPTRITHYDKGYSPLLRLYLTDVLRTALDKTVTDYGAYALEFYPDNLSANRSKLETERGERLDVLFSTHWRGRFVNEKNVTRLDRPIFQGLLGLRSVIVRREQNEQFDALQRAEDLRQFAAGQGSSWADSDVLRANHLKVVGAQHFQSLFPMLAKHRYDFLPLSVLEAQTALQAEQAQNSSLVINQNVCLFYPMPVHLFVNANRPELAARLHKGLEIAANDGTLDSLFQQHFYYVRPIFEGHTKKLIVLQNPFITEAQNQQALQTFLDLYPQVFDVLP